MTDLDRRIHDMFIAAIEKPRSEWSLFLDTACETEELRLRVQVLLDAHMQPGDFLAETALDAFPKLDFPFGGQVEEFKIIRLIGKGGMGHVYLAEDTVLNRLIALKVVRQAEHSAGTKDEVAARFRREARAAARLTHPSVVQVFRAGEKDDNLYIAMEYVDGTNLQEQLLSEQKAHDARTEVRFRRVAGMVSQIADAMDHAHRAGVIHRDIKPSNILIDRQGQARLADFGVARIITEETLLNTGAIVGSCAYMSPEQARVSNVDVDHRSDIFSLGVVLYEAISFQLPFHGENFNDLMKALSDCSPKPLKRVLPKVPYDLTVICHKALEKDVLDRYQSAAHFYADLRSFVENKPILARPPGLARQFRNQLQRYQRFALLAATSFLATALVLTLAVMNAMRRSQMGQLVISERHQGATVSVSLSSANLTFNNPTELGKAPLSVFLKPGLYRVVIESADSTLEASSLIDAGSQDFIEVNDPQEELIRSFVSISAGQYQLGTGDGQNSLLKSRVASVAAFKISPTEVSNREYHEFVVATGAKPPFIWQTPYDPTIDELPVTGITWDEANLYCRWKGARLPTPNEWEAASRGPDANMLPWGDEFNNDIRRQETREFNVESYLKFAKPVKSDHQLATPTGIHHMLSNVQEYTEGVSVDSDADLILKGRSWSDSPFIGVTQYFTLSRRDRRAVNRGFRILFVTKGKR